MIHDKIAVKCFLPPPPPSPPVSLEGLQKKLRPLCRRVRKPYNQGGGYLVPPCSLPPQGDPCSHCYQEGLFSHGGPCSHRCSWYTGIDEIVYRYWEKACFFGFDSIITGLQFHQYLYTILSIPVYYFVNTVKLFKNLAIRICIMYSLYVCIAKFGDSGM